MQVKQFLIYLACREMINLPKKKKKKAKAQKNLQTAAVDHGSGGTSWD